MIKYIALFIGLTITCTQGIAGQVRELIWDDLIPASILAEDPLNGMPETQRETAVLAVYVMEKMPERNPETEDLYRVLDEALPELEAAGIDLDEILAYKKQLYTSVVQDLNGREIRMPGYLLPLELSGSNVTEFLLVPYIGACIHAPPPPPNQIVHVRVADEKGYKNESLFEPVTVTGVVTVKSSVKELFLVDGTDEINIGYSMTATHIKPYEE